MITLQSTPAQIRKELEEDEKRANYWFIKQHHGEKGYNKWRSEQCRKLWDFTEKELFSEPVEYKSPNGNRWLAYEHTSRGSEGDCYSFCYCILYYETMGSVGAYIRMKSEDQITGSTKPGFLHFTSHFSQRFAERLGLEYRSRAMMLRFLQLAHHHLIKEIPTRDGYKDREIVLRYPASYAFGTVREVDEFQMFTVRTFIPVTMLTASKKRDLSEFGEFSDKMTDYLEHERLKHLNVKTQVKLWN